MGERQEEGILGHSGEPSLWGEPHIPQGQPGDLLQQQVCQERSCLSHPAPSDSERQNGTCQNYRKPQEASWGLPDSAHRADPGGKRINQAPGRSPWTSSSPESSYTPGEGRGPKKQRPQPSATSSQKAPEPLRGSRFSCKGHKVYNTQCRWDSLGTGLLCCSGSM